MLLVLGNSPTLKELGEELLDKACVGDVAAIKYLVAVGADPNFVDLEPGHVYACVCMRVCMRVCLCACVYARDDTWELLGVVTRDASAYDRRLMRAPMPYEVRL